MFDLDDLHGCKAVYSISILLLTSTEYRLSTNNRKFYKCKVDSLVTCLMALLFGPANQQEFLVSGSSLTPDNDLKFIDHFLSFHVQIVN